MMRRIFRAGQRRFRMKGRDGAVLALVPLVTALGCGGSSKDTSDERPSRRHRSWTTRQER
jgi:hypothetical protein